MRPNTGFLSKTPSYILNSTHFVQIISEITLQPTDLLVSFDVTSLFTKVSIPDSLNIIEPLLEQDNKSADLAHLIDKCLISTYYFFQGKFFKQISAAAQVVANIFMESLEFVALENSLLKPKARFRYVYDTFIIWSHGGDTLDSLFDQLNIQHPDIKFTMEVEKNGVITFLEIQWSSRSFSLPKTHTQTDRHLHADPQHHKAQKLSVVNSLTDGYRPISLLPGLNKILEPVIEERLLSIVEERSIVPGFPFRFRQEHSTTQQLLRISEHITSNMDKPTPTATITLDIEKAFDKAASPSTEFLDVNKQPPRPLFLAITAELTRETYQKRHPNSVTSS
ncbi:hypothetical protein Trydic_g14953 [Trypoxylus dichotomus]